RDERVHSGALLVAPAKIAGHLVQERSHVAPSVHFVPCPGPEHAKKRAHRSPFLARPTPLPQPEIQVIKISQKPQIPPADPIVLDSLDWLAERDEIEQPREIHARI